MTPQNDSGSLASHFYNPKDKFMSEELSDFIIAISLVVVGVVMKVLPEKIKWGWRLLIGLLAAIVCSVIGHLIAKIFIS